jgi:NTE family protein
MIKVFRKKQLDKALAQTPNYKEWLEIAKELDYLDGYEKWRMEDESPHYNYLLVRRLTDQLRQYRRQENVYRLLDLLHDSLRRAQGDIAHPALYSFARTGTKALVEEFLDEAEKGLTYLCDNDFPHLSHEKKVRLFSQAAANFGRSALLLSGGAAFGLFHLGVVGTLWDHGLLPTVICGSSMGSMVAAGTCTKTDDEIRAIREKRNVMDRDALRRLPLRDMWREKAFMDQNTLLRNIRANVGDYTFAEAFERTGRILNISVSPTRMGMKPRVLNYITAPNVVIATAACASSCVPGVFPPAKLMAKDRTGQILPYMANEKWVDGTVRGDIPVMRLARLHNVNHYIVSQTNPHVLPFLLYHDRKGIVPFAVELVGTVFQAQVSQALNVVRHRVHVSPWRPILDQIYAVTGQQYLGDITVHPAFSPWMYRKLFKNPTQEEMERFTLEGERATWPKLAMIANQTRISRVFDQCLKKLVPQDHTVEARPL